LLINGIRRKRTKLSNNKLGHCRLLEGRFTIFHVWQLRRSNRLDLVLFDPNGLRFLKLVCLFQDRNKRLSWKERRLNEYMKRIRAMLTENETYMRPFGLDIIKRDIGKEWVIPHPFKSKPLIRILIEKALEDGVHGELLGLKYILSRFLSVLGCHQHVQRAINKQCKLRWMEKVRNWTDVFPKIHYIQYAARSPPVN
jgi:hypothetical protein